MFADVEGFTAWSSVREPSQVFTLLETIFAAFDSVALKRRVFKVETVGDCYVAVSGLPEPRQDHAITMARFARDCIAKHMAAVKKLESTLGPETGDLRLRVGLHSGPITAGVLRGERSRFQLFGDTVNTAARLESAGQGNRVHLTATTAHLIEEGGYKQWIERREGTVTLKGMGTMQTYWLVPRKNDQSRSSSDGLLGELLIPIETNSSCDDIKKQRLIAFNADALLRVIKQIVVRREPTAVASPKEVPVWKSQRTIPLAEVVEVIELPHENTAVPGKDLNGSVTEPKIVELVYEYVSALAGMYPDNPFHNFEHASHVTMSVTKLLSRIVAPSDMDFTDNMQASATLHDHTYGITSDPLTQFACVLSALIHDVDHPGVSNATLVAEDNKLMKTYGSKSLAEQNSVDLAWDLLMAKQFQSLVAILCRDESELCRLRQLVVNSVMATDIMDPDLKNLRNGRWEKAFNHTKVENQDTSREAINRKATIVIEHLIQASDVAHTMQHWNVYTKWNARLFKEMYKAYLEGREGAKDPSEFWAKGEIGFFDFYIIPLAKKLKDCGVFGVSSDEYLQYAISNRNEWEEKGEAMTERIINEVRKEYGISEQ
jgi:class 3 adenylate cyclase